MKIRRTTALKLLRRCWFGVALTFSFAVPVFAFDAGPEPDACSMHDSTPNERTLFVREGQRLEAMSSSNVTASSMNNA